MYVRINEKYTIQLNELVQEFIITKNKNQGTLSTSSDALSDKTIKVQDLMVLLKHLIANASTKTSSYFDNVSVLGADCSGSDSSLEGDCGADSCSSLGSGCSELDSSSIDPSLNKDYFYVNKLKNVIITTLEQISIALDGETELPPILNNFSVQDCPICQARIELTEKIIISECMHPICIDCANSYLEKPYTKCPICRVEYKFK